MTALLPWLAALGPALLFLPGLLPDAGADSRPRDMRRLVLGAALANAGLAVLVAVGLVAFGPVPGWLVQLDALSGTMLVLVSGIGAVVVAYSRRYLDGDPGQGRFMRWLSLTLASVLVLVVAGNLVLFAAAWVATGLFLHRLLLFYPERPAAQAAARKRFLANRIGDACLFAAIALVWTSFGTLGFAELSAAARGMADPGLAVHAATLLLALAALIKSAQLPVHGWLPEVMETPTPVSALLHAGIINAGGFLVLRMADVMAASAPALDLLLMVGALTACFGAAVMLTQTSVKVQLAWSTIAQMGFMMMQCGLGAFASALLHIVAHAVYKAHAFLSAGSVAQGRRAEKPAPLPASLLLPALAASVVLVLGTGALFGMPAGEKPGAAVLGAVLMMGLAPTLAASLGARATVPLALRAAGIAVLVCAAYFALQAGAEALLAAALPVDAAPRGLVAVLLSVLAVASFATLLVLNVMRRAAAPSPHVQALHVHLSNGFYLNTATNRLVARIWPQQGTR